MDLYMIHLRTRNLKSTSQMIVDWKTFKSNQLIMYETVLKMLREETGNPYIRNVADVYNFSGAIDNEHIIKDAEVWYDDLKQGKDKKMSSFSGHVIEFKPYDRITMAGKLAMYFIYYTNLEYVRVVKEALIVHMSQFPQLNSTVGILYNKDDKSLRVFDLGAREIVTVK